MIQMQELKDWVEMMKIFQTQMFWKILKKIFVEIQFCHITENHEYN